MALIACPECRQNISSEAVTCPHCGMPIDPRRTKVDYVTGEAIGIQARPAAHAARRPLRYPSPAGVFMMVGGGFLVILGSFMSGMQGGGRFTVVIGLLVVILGLAARSSPSRFPRVLVMIAASLAIVIAGIDNSRLREGLPDNLIGAGVGTVFVGGILALGGTFLRDR
ncbi:MAG: zinc ribbon domain-containing protein [Acidimicrobiia bacterium]